MRTEICEQLSEANRERNSVVSVGSFILLAALITYVVLFPNVSDRSIAVLSGFLSDVWVVFGVAMLVMIVALVLLAVGPWGTVVLGSEAPEFDNITYFAMLLSINISSGIAFYGPSESLLYLRSPPPGVPPDAGASQLAAWAVSGSLIHWGFIASATTAVFAVPIAYYSFCHGAPFRVSTAIYPLIEDRAYVAGMIDIIAVASLAIGLTWSLTNTTQNFLSGLEYQWGVSYPAAGIAIFMLAVAVVVTTSIVTGLHRGIARLSLVSLGLLALVTVLIFVFGPTVALVSLVVDATLTRPVQAYHYAVNMGGEWSRTFNIWPIWFSIAGGYGLFTARVSRGRTIREVIGYSAIASGLTNMLWIYVVGGSVVLIHQSGQTNVLELVGTAGTEVAAFPLVLSLPAAEIVLLLFLLLGLLFIINSADSQALSASMMSSTNTASPHTLIRVFWGGITGLTSIFLVVFTGGKSIDPITNFVGLLLALLGVVALGVLLSSLIHKRYTASVTGADSSV